MRKRSKVIGVLAVVVTVLLAFLDAPGRVQSAQDIAGGKVTWLAVLLQWLIWPPVYVTVALACLIWFASLQHDEDKFKQALDDVERWKAKYAGASEQNGVLATQLSELWSVLDQKQNLVLATALRQKHTEAIAIYNDHRPKSRADVDSGAWTLMTEKWVHELVGLLRNHEVPHALIHHLESVDRYEVLPRLPVHPEAIHEASKFLARIDRLENVILRYSKLS